MIFFYNFSQRENSKKKKDFTRFILFFKKLVYVELYYRWKNDDENVISI